MGFDNSACALTLEPNLSTVNADPMQLGYQAVMNYQDILSGKVHDVTVESSPIYRESCGCRRKDFTGLAVDEKNIFNQTFYRKSNIPDIVVKVSWYDDKIKEITDPNIHNYPLQIINSLIITERS